MKKLAYLILSSSILLFGCRGVTNISKNLSAKKFEQTTYVTISHDENNPIKFKGDKYLPHFHPQEIKSIIKESFKEKVEKLGATYYESMPENIPHDVLAYNIVFDVTLSEDINQKKYTNAEKGYKDYPYEAIRTEVKGNSTIYDARDNSVIDTKSFIINAREDIARTELPPFSHLSNRNPFSNYIDPPSADFPTLSMRYGERIAIWLSKKIN